MEAFSRLRIVSDMRFEVLELMAVLSFFFFKQKTAYEILYVTGVQTCALPIYQPQRFVHSRAVGAHVGLTPKRYQSGEVDYDGGVSKCGDALLRTMLYEAAHSLLTHSGKWSWLKAWGMRVAQRRGIRRAIVAVARRLAVVLHRMWVDGSEFRWGKDSAAAPTVA